MESKSAEDPVKDVPEVSVKPDDASSSEVKPTADNGGSAAGDSATVTDANKKESIEEDRRSSEEIKADESGAGEVTKTDEGDKVESVANPGLEDEPEEKFEDAVDSEQKLEENKATEPLKDSPSDATLASLASDNTPKSPSPEPATTPEVTEAYEIDDSPEKSPVKVATPSSVVKPRPGPSTVRQLPATIKSREIETVDLDDDDDEDEYDDDEVALAATVRDLYDDDEEDDFEEDDEDDYYEDPESDDQDVNQVIQGTDSTKAIDEIESGEEDKMDVSSDEDDYSEDDDEAGVLVLDSIGRAKRQSGEECSDEKDDYDDDEDVDEPEEDEDDDDDVEEVIELDGKQGGRRALGSMGQISVEDESDEDIVVPQKKKSQIVKYKTYRQKMMAKIRRRTYKM